MRARFGKFAAQPWCSVTPRRSADHAPEPGETRFAAVPVPQHEYQSSGKFVNSVDYASTATKCKLTACESAVPKDYSRYTRQLDAGDFFRRALEEDVGSGDVTTEATVSGDLYGIGRFRAKRRGVLAGLEVAERIFRELDSEAEATWQCTDGEEVAGGTLLGSVRARVRALLMGERLALNLIQRMSGIATATCQMVRATAPHAARIRDTRKTAPGLRLLDKWAVQIGGGHNHRMGLYDRILIKDNHIAAAGGIQAALEAARRHVQSTGNAIGIDVEARTMKEVAEALATGGFDVLLLDNMGRTGADGSLDVSLLRAAVERVGGRHLTEASGNVTIETVAQIAATGVDFISVGSLTHSVKALDISLNIEVR